METFLLEETDPYLDKTLKDAVARKKPADEQIEPVWRKNMDDWLNQRGMEWSVCARTVELLASPWFKVMPARKC